jgi:hypothetical protein
MDDPPSHWYVVAPDKLTDTDLVKHVIMEGEENDLIIVGLTLSF